MITNFFVKLVALIIVYGVFLLSGKIFQVLTGISYKESLMAFLSIWVVVTTFIYIVKYDID